MKVWISDSDSTVVTCLALEEREQGSCEIQCLEGEMPAGLTIADLTGLGIVVYEPDTRGRPIPKVCPITPSENLDYLRALIEAMPPGFFVSKVESEKIDMLREQKVERFQQELERIEEDEA
jgi:hypothetical protein